MPHFKCVGCKTRVYSAARPTDLADALCPGCGGLFEPVGELAEIVGFQSITQRDSATGTEALAAAIALTIPEESP
jgi:hypothetical protein